MTLARGWKQRRADADARRADRVAAWDDDRADVRRQRAALAESARLEAEAAAAAREAEIRTAVVECPCCAGLGYLKATDAALIVEAVERYKGAGHRPAPATVAKLMAESFLVDSAGNRVETAPAHEPVVEAPQEPVKAAKSSRRQIVAPPFLGGED